MVAIEAGWWLAEVGRQPWIRVEVSCERRTPLRRADKLTQCCPVCLLYLILGGGSVVVLRKIFRNNPVEHEIEVRTAEKGGDVL